MARARARPSTVAPICLIVAVAIVCIVAAVLNSAQRADEVALQQEQRLFARAITERGNDMLRVVESVARSDETVRNTRVTFDRNWLHRQVGLRLTSIFANDYVFLIGSDDSVLYAFGEKPLPEDSLPAARADLAPILAALRGTAKPATKPAADRTAAPVDKPVAKNASGAQHLHLFLGRPAIVAAAAVVPADLRLSGRDDNAPVLAAVRFVDNDMLADISARLDLPSLHMLGPEGEKQEDHVFAFLDEAGKPIARFAWLPKEPGGQIVTNVVPFIAIALGEFTLLAAFVLHYMQRTTATIAASEERLRHLAMHDPLCGLPNRMYFGERLETVIEGVRAGAPPAAVLLIDLDHFKDVNDTLGHHVGDALIRTVAQRLGAVTRADDLVARIGGDEFAVVTHGVIDNKILQHIAERIIASLCAPYAIMGHTIVIGASIGIAHVDLDAGEAADIMRRADVALYRAKNEGRNRACSYDADMDADLRQRKQLEQDLRNAVENGKLEVHYQPVVRADGEVVVGVEALARWTHPERGAIPPSEFIPIAEQSNLIVALGELVLRRACLDAGQWPDIYLAVNVSPLQFRRSDFVDVIQNILMETKFDPRRLELELTETTLLGNLEGAEAAMDRLKKIGVRLALDDFGTGYSSLLYLRRFPFDRIKIDQSFVRSIESTADAAAIVHAVVGLGRGLGMRVTAEGVETADQHLFLRAAGVHSLQGYRFGKADTAAVMTQRLATQTASAEPANKPIAKMAG